MKISYGPEIVSITESTEIGDVTICTWVKREVRIFLSKEDKSKPKKVNSRRRVKKDERDFSTGTR